jgi:hypothetical protein
VAELASTLAPARSAAYEVKPHTGAALASNAGGPAPQAEGLAMLWLSHGSVVSDAVGRARTQLRSSASFPVDEHVIHDDGNAATVVRVGFIRRHDHLSHSEFVDHWLNVHTALVMAHQPLFGRYVANVLDPAGGWDGIVEQHFADAATWDKHDRRILTERPVVREDISRMIAGMTQFAAVPVA